MFCRRTEGPTLIFWSDRAVLEFPERATEGGRWLLAQSS
jgi:hypothetical protein